MYSSLTVDYTALLFDIYLGLYCSPKANGGNGTCTPSYCSVTSTASSCVFGHVDNPNYQAMVDSKKCKQCTQSNDNRCSYNYLQSIIPPKTSLLAAYCNDKYFVILTTTMATFEGSLSEVPWPPGGSGGCRTRSESNDKGVQAWKFPLATNPLPTASRTNNLDYFKSQSASYLYNSETGLEYGLPEDGGVAAFTNGQLSWPVFNNR